MPKYLLRDTIFIFRVHVIIVYYVSRKKAMYRGGAGAFRDVPVFNVLFTKIQTQGT